MKRSVKRRVKGTRRGTRRVTRRRMSGGNQTPLNEDEINIIVEKVVRMYPRKDKKGAILETEKERIREKLRSFVKKGKYVYEFHDPESDRVRDMKGNIIKLGGKDDLKARAHDLAIGMWSKGY